MYDKKRPTGRLFLRQVVPYQFDFKGTRGEKQVGVASRGHVETFRGIFSQVAA